MKRINKIRILLADRQQLVRSGLRKLLEESNRFTIVGEAEDGSSAISLTRKLKPHVSIIDPAMLDISGLDLVRKLKESNPRTSLMVLSDHLSESDVVEALRAGASAYMSKSVSKEEITFGVYRILSGMRHLGPTITDLLINHYMNPKRDDSSSSRDSLGNLSKREKEIVYHVAHGLSNQQIASKLYISSHTVHNHRINIMKKLKIHSTTDLVLAAVRSNLIDLEENGTHLP